MRRAIGICPATLLAQPFTATPADIAAAAAAALAVGLTESSVWTFQLDAFAASDLRVTCIEAAQAWAGDDDDAAAAEAEQLAALVDRHRPSYLLAVTMEPSIPEPAAASRHLEALAARVGPLGTQVCVEFLPWCAISDLRRAWDLVEPLGPEVGLLLDTFHWQRQVGGPDFDLLATIPGDRVVYVQVSDAAPGQIVASESEAMTGRLLPGEGVVDFAALFGVLDHIGAEPFITTEIFNPTYVEEVGPDRAARAMRDAAMSVLP